MALSMQGALNDAVCNRKCPHVVLSFGIVSTNALPGKPDALVAFEVDEGAGVGKKAGSAKANCRFSVDSRSHSHENALEVSGP